MKTRKLLKPTSPLKLKAQMHQHIGSGPFGMNYLWDAVGRMLYFPNLEPGQDPVKGERCEYEDGQPAHGEFLMPDLSIIRVNEGTVTRVTLPREKLIQEAIASRRRVNPPRKLLKSLHVRKTRTNHSFNH